MRIRVTLKNLNTKDVLLLTNDLPIYVYKKDNYDFVGTCLVYQDDEKNYYGELNLNTEVSEDLYFYYRARANNSGIYMFAGLDLMENEISSQPTVRLKEVMF